MKKLGLVLCLSSLLAVSAFAKDTKMTGWISDSKCGAKGANAAHAGCAAKCVSSGEKPVFVSDSDQKVMAIENPDAVKDVIGQHVNVTGAVTGGALHVASVSAAK